MNVILLQRAVPLIRMASDLPTAETTLAVALAYALPVQPMESPGNYYTTAHGLVEGVLCAINEETLIEVEAVSELTRTTYLNRVDALNNMCGVTTPLCQDEEYKELAVKLRDVFIQEFVAG